MADTTSDSGYTTPPDDSLSTNLSDFSGLTALEEEVHEAENRNNSDSFNSSLGSVNQQQDPFESDVPAIPNSEEVHELSPNGGKKKRKRKTRRKTKRKSLKKRRKTKKRKSIKKKRKTKRK